MNKGLHAEGWQHKETLMKRIIATLALLLAASAAYADFYRPNGDSWTVATNPYTSTAAATLVPSDSNTVRVVSSVDVYLSIGVTPNAAATSDSMFVPAYSPEYFNLFSGEQVAVLSVAATGTVYLTGMTQ